MNLVCMCSRFPHVSCHSIPLPNLKTVLFFQGDLGAIEEKYDVAISTACGALDNIVVDTINTGQKCVEFLRKNNVGVATFILLDKMAKWKDHCKKKINTYVLL